MDTSKVSRANEPGFSFYYNNIPERVVNALKATAERENVFEFSILLSAIAILVRRHVGHEKTNLSIKTADLSAKIEIDLTSVSTVGELLKQSQSKLEETLKCSFGRGLEIELPGDVMRPVIRFLNESIDSRTMTPLKNENDDKAGCGLFGSEKHDTGAPGRQIERHFIQILSDILENPDAQINGIPAPAHESKDWISWCV